MSRHGLLHALLGKSLSQIHQARLGALFDTVGSLLNGARLTLTDLGRHMPSKTTAKHNIKKVDRLLANQHLQLEAQSIYQVLTQCLLGHVKKWVVLVDVCFLKDHHHYQTIRASIALQGRALTLYELAFTKTEVKKSYSLFLNQLKVILPPNQFITLVCDAGFKPVWYKQVEACGWDWVGRIRKKSQKIQHNKQWYDPEMLWSNATTRAKSIGQVMLSKQHQLLCNLISYRKNIKGRMKKNWDGQRCRRSESREYSRQSREPWLLATSLSYPAKSIVALYEKRMQIEESFRDLKSHRFGLGARYSGTRDIKRWIVLLLVANLGLFLLWLVGRYARTKGYERLYRSNVRPGRYEFSDIFLGLLVIRQESTRSIRRLLYEAWRHLKWEGAYL